MLILLPWNWRARNVTTLSLIFWLTLCNVTRGINAIVWGGSTVVKYRVWGDISECLSRTLRPFRQLVLGCSNEAYHWRLRRSAGLDAVSLPLPFPDCLSPSYTGRPV
jgi:hypothetical protein